MMLIFYTMKEVNQKVVLIHLDIYSFSFYIQEALLSAKEEMQNLTIREMELTNEVIFSIVAVL